VDLYRLETAREVASLGLDEFFDRDDAIVLIEWGERFPELMPAERMEIRIEGHDYTREISSSLRGLDIAH
jgi:tRNA threonylcarbamoyladenosine biosynthesis protein TsaE